MSIESNSAGRLSPRERNLLQISIATEMLGHEPTDNEMLGWISAYAKKVSDIIDTPEHEDICALYRSGNVSEAVRAVRDLLPPTSFIAA